MAEGAKAIGVELDVLCSTSALDCGSLPCLFLFVGGSWGCQSFHPWSVLRSGGLGYWPGI
jgi:hypothetical protein